jgi:hypothetical protein
MTQKEAIAKIKEVCGKCCHEKDCHIICEDVVGYFDVLEVHDRQQEKPNNDKN